ncbi:DUF4113 domain-containing protein [Methylorubrum extorquens]
MLRFSQRALIGRLDRERSASLMEAFAAFYASWGRGAMVPAQSGLEQQRRGWETKFGMQTPRYTTQVDELPVALA